MSKRSVALDPRVSLLKGMTHPLAGGGMSNATLRLLIVLNMFILSAICVNAIEKDVYVPEVGKSVRPKMKVLTKEDRGTYECCLIEFSLEKSERAKGYLLVPENASRDRKCPAVLMLHDHGARFDIGKEKLVRPMASILPCGENDHITRSSRQWTDKNFDGIFFADSLASLGYVVFVTDALYWGDRSDEEAQRWSELTYGDPDDASLPEDRTLDKKARKDTLKALKTRVYDGQKILYDTLLDKGVIWAEKMLRDDAASVRLLRSLPFVDKGNIGAFGFSMGAHRCWMLAAFCDDLKCGVCLSWMTSLDKDERMKPSDFSMAVMAMREQMDFGDIGMFLAPKPMMFINGISDHLFSEDKVQTAFSKLQKHYTDYNRSHRTDAVQPPFSPLETIFFDGGHHCGKDVQALTVQFFDTYLK